MKRAFLATSTVALTSAVLVFAAPLAASAHVSVTPDSAPAGQTAQLTFSVGHGCDGAATTALAFTIPETILAVTPTVNPNWEVTKTSVDLAEPVTDAHGNSLVQRVGEVTYTAKQPLADGYRDTVTLQLTLPENAVGKAMAFPVVQSCEGGETAWTEIAEDGQDPHDLEFPAPTVTVTDAPANHDGTAEASGHASASDASGTTTPVSAEPDTLARILGLGGLIVGAIGVILAVLARRPVAPSQEG
ncbi:YcnI family protein [Mycetocola zhadangensis]|uniref:YcnI family copper-binding membrane protein n=1 Tax=Mycetocola zhadangensis TaxID=1164595 RepID=UPI003A4D344B